MLQTASQLGTDTGFKMLFKGWIALDPDTGAYLSQSRGRSASYNAPKYVLIVPKEKPADLFSVKLWDWDRAFIRAWTLEEALQIANQRLDKILAKRQKG